MGKQVNFYMTIEDEAEFANFVKSDHDIVFIAYMNPTAEPVPVKSLPQSDVPGWFLLWLWDCTNSPNPKLCRIPEQGYYVVDGLLSEVIEFSRSYLTDDGLVRGRIWAEVGYWDLDRSPPCRVRKSEAFQQRFNRLANWIKLKGKQNAAGEYVLPGAINYEASGGRLCQMNMAPDVKQIKH